jgi:hypothetical protein
MSFRNNLFPHHDGCEEGPPLSPRNFLAGLHLTLSLLVCVPILSTGNERVAPRGLHLFPTTPAGTGKLSAMRERSSVRPLAKRPTHPQASRVWEGLQAFGQYPRSVYADPPQLFEELVLAQQRDATAPQVTKHKDARW